MNELMVWLQDLQCQTEDDMNFLVGGPKTIASSFISALGGEMDGLRSNFYPNVHQDIVRKVSSSAFYWCQNNRVVPLQNDMIKIFKGLK